MLINYLLAAFRLLVYVSSHQDKPQLVIFESVVEFRCSSYARSHRKVFEMISAGPGMQAGSETIFVNASTESQGE